MTQVWRSRAAGGASCQKRSVNIYLHYTTQVRAASTAKDLEELIRDLDPVNIRPDLWLDIRPEKLADK